MRRPIALVTMLMLAACAAGPARQGPVSDDGVPHGIVLVVGDGMGVAHFTLARLLRGDEFETGRLSHIGLVATASTDQRATDSAASATAYATGVKTKNHYLGLDADGRPLQTVVELARARGLATGLVTTAPLADATPAAFVVHARDRHETAEVTRQFVTGGVDLLVSGGLSAYEGEASGTLEALAEAGGYTLIRTADDLQSSSATPVLAVLPSGPRDSDSPEIALPQLAAWALERLARDPDGFFLLLEHEGTDTASHRNDRPALEDSLRSLDETVGVAMDFARRSGDILVIVVGDHETGALQIAGGWDEPADAWGSRDHTGAAVPLFAAGPGAAAFGGFRDNSDVGQALLALVGRMGR